MRSLIMMGPGVRGRRKNVSQRGGQGMLLQLAAERDAAFFQVR